MPFTFKPGEASKTFKLILSKEDYNKVTDFSFQVLNDSGVAVVKDGLSYRTGEISITPAEVTGGSNLIFELVPAFTNASDSMTVTVKEETAIDSQYSFLRWEVPEKALSLYPSIDQKIYLKFIQNPRMIYRKILRFTGTVTFDIFSLNRKLNMNFQLNSNSKREILMSEHTSGAIKGLPENAYKELKTR